MAAVWAGPKSRLGGEGLGDAGSVDVWAAWFGGRGMEDEVVAQR